jgi:uncharacterized membrane protein YhaH (DUF805 family)
MSPIGAIANVFSNYANFKGRATRSEYWWWQAFLIALQVLITVVFGTDPEDTTGNFLVLGLILVLAIPTIAVSIRRMHDIGRRGWWILFPIVNFIFSLLPSKSEANQWGPPPPPRGS